MGVVFLAALIIAPIALGAWAFGLVSLGGAALLYFVGGYVIIFALLAQVAIADHMRSRVDGEASLAKNTQ